METWRSDFKFTFSISRLLFSLIIAITLSSCDNAPTARYQGYVEGDFTYISSETSGKIVNILVKRGDQVTGGQKLAVLDDQQQLKQIEIDHNNYTAEVATLQDLGKGQRPQELQVVDAQISQAKNDEQIAASKLKRYEKIKAQGYVSDFEFLQTQAEYKQKRDRVKELLSQLDSHKLPSRDDQIMAQKARVESTRKQLEKSEVELNKRTLYSIDPAMVYDVMYHPGEVVSPGQPLLSLLPQDAIKVRFFIPHKQLHKFALGQKIKVWIDGINQPVPAEIRFISPKAEYTPPVIYSKDQRERMVFMVEAVPLSEIQNLKLGQPVEVEQ